MLFFIVNPTSSSGNGIRIWKNLQKKLRSQDIPFRRLILKNPGDASAAAAKLSRLQDHGTVVIVGGDGTINEFLNGLTKSSHLTISVIPTGSGNDFARGLNLPANPQVCLDHILKSKRHELLNTGLVRSGEKQACFGVSSGIGFDAAVCYEAAKGSFKTFLNRIRLGKLVYLITALHMLLTIRPFSLKLTMDGKTTVSFPRTWFAAAMNTRFEGGGFMFCPEADPCDGSLDLIIAEGISRFRILATIPLAFSGAHVKKPGIHIYRCHRADINADRPSCVHTDGEHFDFCTDVTWELKNEGLKVIR